MNDSFDLTNYWDTRYRAGRDSGISSSGQLAKAKADYVNDMLARYDIMTVIDFGCGDGQQLDLLDIPHRAYLGTDVSMEAINLCRTRHPRKRFIHRSRMRRSSFAQCSLSLDVMFHQVADADYVRHLRDLFGRATKLVIIHATNTDSGPITHVRNRWFTPLVFRMFPEWELIDGGEGREFGNKQAFYTYLRRDIGDPA